MIDHDAPQRIVLGYLLDAQPRLLRRRRVQRLHPLDPVQLSGPAVQ